MKHGTVVWFTGLPCAGKTTLAQGLFERAVTAGYDAELLDGDVMRTVAPGLGFSPEQRKAHLLRVAYTAALLAKRGVVVLCAFVTPLESIRKRVKMVVDSMSGGRAAFHMVYVKADLETCKSRDVKGMYARALAGEIQDFTGVSAPFEEPQDYNWLIDTDFLAVEAALDDLVAMLHLHPQRHALFIGRWQPFHKGHQHIIDQALQKGDEVCVAIRNTPVTPTDPFTVQDRVEMIRAVYGDAVSIIVIPDIKSINIGRRVGYEVNRVDVPEFIGRVSATNIRTSIQSGDGRWQDNLPGPVVEWVMNHPGALNHLAEEDE